MATRAEALRRPASFKSRTERCDTQAVPYAMTAARVLLIFTLMAAPFAFGAVQSWAWAGLTVMAALLSILWAVGCVQQRALAIHWSHLYVPAALFILLGTGQFFGHLTLDPFATREALIKLVTDMIFFFLAVQLWADAPRRAWKWLGLTVVAYAFLISMFAIVQFFTSHGLLYWTIHTQGDVFGPYVNHNDYAGLMEMLIPIGMCFAIFQSLKNSNQTLLLVAVAGAITSVLLSGSRGGMISVAAEMVILVALAWRGKTIWGSNRRWRALGLIGAAGMAALLLAATPDSGWQRLASIAGLVRKPDVTLGNRLAVAHDALAEVRDYPWLGTGLGSFATVFPQYQSFPMDLKWNHAHDDYVEALTETGVAGGLIILSALVLLGWLAFRDLPDRIKSGRGWIQLGASLGCCGLLIHSFADFNLRIPANAAWFALCAALSTLPVIVTASTDEPTRRRSSHARKLSGKQPQEDPANSEIVAHTAAKSGI